MDNTELPQVLVIMLTALCVSACARTIVTPETEISISGLPQPQQIVVYEFAVTEAEATEHAPAGKTAHERSGPSEVNLEMGRQMAKVLAEELVLDLREFGFDVKRKPRGTPIGRHQLLIDGEFLDVDKGSQLERLVIGFGVGASKMDTEVHVYYETRHRKLLDFRTHADSGKMPGAAATMGAGVVIGAGITAGTAAASATSGAVKEYHSDLERMAGHSADQAAAYLSEFFAKEGWIRPDQIKKATVDR